MRFRLAFEGDVFAVIRLYQKSNYSRANDELFSDYKRLATAIAAEDSIWVIAEIEGTPKAMVSMLLDRDQRICKITRMLVDPDVSSQEIVLRHALGFVLDYLKNTVKEVDFVYTTTLSMSMDHQELTLDEGFKILGVFPNLLGEDNSQLNGMTGYFYEETLAVKRHADFPLHHMIEPFFRIAQRQCGLPDLPVADAAAVAETLSRYGGLNDAEELPPLEIINAPRFVERRFHDHREKHSQLVNFYPFYSPNCMITDPNQECEIFVRLTDKMRFAAVIGEHLERSLNPVQLYLRLQQLLRSVNVSYIEIINDAADVFGIECIIRSGFTPCAYIPAFKRQGEMRRDYVIFGKSFEYLCRPNLDTYKAYIDFYKEYFRIEGKNYFPEFVSGEKL